MYKEKNGRTDEIISEMENVKKENKNKTKILICGLISGIITKSLFAPFDRIRLFYQIQPMFNNLNKKDKYSERKKKNINNINKEILKKGNSKIINNLNEEKHFKNNELYKINKFNNGFVYENIIFKNFKKALNVIKIKKKKKKYYNSNKLHLRNSNHQVLKKIFHYKYILPYNIVHMSKNTKYKINYDLKKIINKLYYFNLNKENANVSFKYKNIVQSFLHIVKEEGVIGLWRGNFINILRGGIVYSAKFGSNDIIKEKYRQNNKESEYKINYYESIIAGYSSAIIQKTSSYPLDFLSIRMALGINEKYFKKENIYKKKNCFKLINEIFKKEGFFGFFKGFFPTLLTGIPYVTLQMFLFDVYKNIFQSIISNNNNSLAYTALYSSISGSLSNLTSLIIVFPGDTVRKRMMNNGIDNKHYLYKNSFHCIKSIYYNEGIKNFYFGLFPSIIKSLPSGAIQFLSYEILKQTLSQKN